MPSIKVHPPERLPEGELSEQDFQAYKTELEVFLSMDEKLRPFLNQGGYNRWVAAEEGGQQLRERHMDDNEAQLAERNIDLKLFLSLVAKTLPKSRYSTVMQHSTSLQSIYDMIRQDYDIQTRGIHVLNIIELKYDKNSMKPIAFYNQYRAMVMNNMAKTGDVIRYKNNREQTADETMGPCFEDMVFINVLTGIDARLPGHIKKVYAHKLANNLRLMDFKTDILVNVPKFMEELEEKEQLLALRTDPASLAAFRTDYGRGSFRGATGAPPSRRGSGRGSQGSGRTANQQSSKDKKSFCRSCWEKDKGRSIFNSHNAGDKHCPTASSLGNVAANEGNEEEEEADPRPCEFGEEDDMDPNLAPTLHQVPKHENKLQNLTRPPDLPHLEQSCNCIRCQRPSINLGRISAEPTQILTVFVDSANKQPIHIDLDSGANVGFISLAAVNKHGFKMKKCSQLSRLGDGYTTLPSIGEIHETFYRNGWSVTFRALVVEKLHSDLVGGTTFLKDNAIIQDFNRATISVHDRKHTVMDTKKESTLTISPQVQQHQVQQLQHMQLGQRTLLPGQHLHQSVDMPDGEVVLVQGYLHNTIEWPEAQLCTVSQGKVEVVNDTQAPIMIGRKAEVKTLKILHTQELTNLPETTMAKPADNNYYTFNNVDTEVKSGLENLKKISFGPSIDEGTKKLIETAHIKHHEVFNESLKGGYNHHFGPYECKLNWASQARPQANKLRVVNYSHELNGLLQEVMDDLTRQEVLKDPQELNISVQSICSAFLTRKQRAKNKPKHLLTKDDVRLLVNFGPVNSHIKDVPTPMTTIEDIFNTLGKFKHIIVFDLYNGFFQNHMSADSLPWLGLMSPFGGLRVITRSAQGLLGMSEEFSLLMRQVLKEELQKGICCLLIDDVIVGGATEEEAANNYILILQKLALANLKVSPAKTHIFPDQVDILGWVWRKGGKLEPSPHRRNALVNTKKEDIITIKDMRSFVGLYKTLRRATPNMAQLMAPLEEAVADKESKQLFPWTHALEMRFKEAQAAVEEMHTLYLPSPSDRLAIVPDAARVKPGIGHILYAIKNDQKIPVRFHSVKLPDKCEKWQPCEIEALAFATAIEAEYDLIRESKHPLLMCPDSKVVADAVALIQKGKYSSSARINKLITNVNKVPLQVAHVSGKAKLNEGADYQSRSPSKCNSEVCSICRFVDEQIHGVIDPAAKNAAATTIPTISMGNRQAWRKAQRNDLECDTAHKHLESGKTPSSKSGESLNIIRRYCREATIAKDKLLVVREQGKESTGWLARERIVVPQKLLPTLLYQIHHNDDNHPTKSQMKLQFERSFYGIELDKHIAQLYQNCYKCSLLQRLPKVEKSEQSKAEVSHPHQYFHIDVIRRAKQHILLLVDHFSNFQTAKLIPSEKAVDLKDGLIVLSEGVRQPGPIKVKADNAKGFESLAKNDPDLTRLNIEIIFTDVFNKNSNAVIDRACQELEEELRKLSPEGNPISQATLAQAQIQVNKKIRRQGKLSAYEIHAARDANTGENLQLNDQNIRTDQLQSRAANRKVVKEHTPSVQVGDTVVMNKGQDKHKAREAFLVTKVEDDKVMTQKLIHPLVPGKSKLMSKVYTTDTKHVVIAHKAHHSRPPLQHEQNGPPSTKAPSTPEYDPINPRFWNDTDSDSEEEPLEHQVQQVQVMPPDPPPRPPHRRRREQWIVRADVVAVGTPVQPAPELEQVPVLHEDEQEAEAEDLPEQLAQVNLQAIDLHEEERAQEQHPDVSRTGRVRKEPSRYGFEKAREPDDDQDKILVISEPPSREITPQSSPKPSPNSSMAVEFEDHPPWLPVAEVHPGRSARERAQDILERHRHWSATEGRGVPSHPRFLAWKPSKPPDQPIDDGNI